MSFYVIIPARYGSHRLPGKPLLDIVGKPMIQHVYDRAKKSGANEVIIATDDARIQSAAEEFGAKVLMTAVSHTSGTERIQEVVSELGLDPLQIIVNLQADEPLMPPSAIDQVARNLKEKNEVGITTLCELISSRSEIEDPNVVKVVMNERGEALYFSRSIIPHQGGGDNSHDYFRHIGIYAYRVMVLNQFVKWPISKLENAEKLEQLRALQNGVKIHVEVSSHKIPAGVDTEKDLEIVRGKFS